MFLFFEAQQFLNWKLTTFRNSLSWNLSMSSYNFKLQPNQLSSQLQPDLRTYFLCWFSWFSCTRAWTRLPENPTFAGFESLWIYKKNILLYQKGFQVQLKLKWAFFCSRFLLNFIKIAKNNFLEKKFSKNSNISVFFQLYFDYGIAIGVLQYRIFLYFWKIWTLIFTSVLTIKKNRGNRIVFG